MTEGRNPAVVAGLLSGLVLVAEPASAYALTANEIRQTPLGAIFTGIGVGLAAVAVISGAALVVSRSVNRGEKIYSSYRLSLFSIIFNFYSDIYHTCLIAMSIGLLWCNTMFFQVTVICG